MYEICYDPEICLHYVDESLYIVSTSNVIIQIGSDELQTNIH